MDVVIRFLFFGPSTMEAASECLGKGAEPHIHTQYVPLVLMEMSRLMSVLLPTLVQPTT